MFKKKSLLIAVAISFLSVNAMAAFGDDPEVLYPPERGTADALQPKIWFAYDAGKDGVVVDLVKILKDGSTDPSVDPSVAGDCGDGVVTAYVPLSSSDISCGATSLPSSSDASSASTFCTWLVPSALIEDGVYGVNISMVDIDSADTLTAIAGRTDANCDGTATDPTTMYQTFKVDTTTAPVIEPTAPPAKVTIISPAADADCILGADDADKGKKDSCSITFTHANAPSATWYKVWINDKNGIQANPSKLSDDGVDGKNSYSGGGGWFKAGTITHGNDTGTIRCKVDLADTRTCSLSIGKNHGGYDAAALPKAGAPYTVWVGAYNVKGVSDWSSPLSFIKLKE